MENKDLLIGCVKKDIGIANMLADTLNGRNIPSEVYSVPGIPTRMDECKVWFASVQDRVRNARCIMLLITENAIADHSLSRELASLISIIKDRAKKMLIARILPATVTSNVMGMDISGIPCVAISEITPDELESFAGRIAWELGKEDVKKVLYERLSAYEKAGGTGKEAETLCALNETIRRQIEGEEDKKTRKDLYGELYRCLERMSNLYYPALFTEKRDIVEELTLTGELIDREETVEKEPFFLAVAIRFIYLERDISKWAGGNKSDQEYADKQYPYLVMLFEATKNTQIEDNLEKQEELPPETLFWLETRNYVIRKEDLKKAKEEAEKKNPGGGVITAALLGVGAYLLGGPALLGAGLLGGLALAGMRKGTDKKDKQSPGKPAEKEKPAEPIETEEDIRLKKVADFMKQGNEVLDMIGEDDAAEDFLRCLLTSYQRLHAYCEVIGEKKICLACLDRIVELEERLKAIEGSEKKGSTKAETGLRTLLGLARPQTGTFDVFICHKSEDMDIAEDMYGFFRQNMLEPFFDKKTLPELAESEYRKAIMQALDRSAHFVVLASDLAYLQSKWVALEMETFKHEMAEGRKEGSNFLLVVTDGVYEEIVRNNKQNLDIEYRSCEMIRVSEYRERILKYVRRT